LDFNNYTLLANLIKREKMMLMNLLKKSNISWRDLTLWMSKIKMRKRSHYLPVIRKHRLKQTNKLAEALMKRKQNQLRRPL
jgi:uncharacterized protein YpbB